ncbi:MAG: serine/threonine-protein kinase [Myxococcota bacterium]
MASSQPSIGPVRSFGRFTLVKKLATGGMAEIWLARQRGLAGFNRFVVIKKILPHLSEQSTFVEMFLDEARTSAQLNHPNIVQIFDLGKEADAYYIAMEFIAGENLSAVAWRGLQHRRPLPFALSARTIAETCRALHYAHTLVGTDGRPLEIVHRDVSPQNVLLSYDGAVKVVDFGIAKAATKSEQTKTGMLKGKFSYMSPEQCLGHPVDARSDIFALGILLYELTTGKRLFKHESELMILEMITKRPIVPPRKVAPKLPVELEAIILKALRKSPRERFASAEDMQLQLESFLESSSEPSSTAELSRYMQGLFQDKMEEKQRLRELASKDDVLARHAVPTDPVAMELPTGAATSMERPLHATGSLTQWESSGATRAAETQPVAARPEQRALPVALIVIALVVMSASGLVLWRRFAPAMPTSTTGLGSVSLESKPTGATIYLDGEPMRLPDGSFARTPADIGPLRFGERYELSLRLEHHDPFSRQLEMDATLAGSTLRPELVAHPGRLRVEVKDGIPTRLLDGGQDLGIHTALVQEVDGGSEHILKGERSQHDCLAEPERIKVPPGQEAMVRILCRPSSPPPRAAEQGAPRRRRSAAIGTRARAEPAPVPARPAPAGCAPDERLPPGYLTIDTRPHSVIFWRDRRLGETPISKAKVPAGCLELRAESASGTKTLKVRIEPNKVSIFRTKL